jgi:chromosome partitioning protein
MHVDLLLDFFKELSEFSKVIVFLVLMGIVVGLIVSNIVTFLGRQKRASEISELKKSRDDALRELEELQHRFVALDKVDDHVWKRPVQVTPPVFVSRSKRKTRFISICNLKGGVGKSTVAGNLGLALAMRQQSVLMIDLDFQRTLSSYVCDVESLVKARAKDQTSKHLLNPAADVKIVHQYALSIPSVPQARIIPADEGLELTEYAQQARFFVKPEYEVRFLLRRLLHDEAVTEQFQYVLFDCPPRMTTACINALTCSDAVLVPTSLDQVDIDAVYRTLTWLKELKDIHDIEIIGIILSKCQMRKGKLTKQELGQLKSFEESLKRHSPDNIVVFDAKIPDSPFISRSAGLRRPSVLDDETRHWFLDLAEEVERRIRHETG